MTHRFSKLFNRPFGFVIFMDFPFIKFTYQLILKSSQVHKRNMIRNHE